MSPNTAEKLDPTSEIKRGLILIMNDILKLDLSVDDVSDETNLYELGLESLKVVELLSAVERNFDIIIDVEDLSAELFSRFENVVTFIQAKRDGD
ncbi:MAG: phosphopantetheine-binding protein [Myxococcota bacterium]